MALTFGRRRHMRPLQLFLVYWLLSAVGVFLVNFLSFRGTSDVGELLVACLLGPVLLSLFLVTRDVGIGGGEISFILFLLALVAAFKLIGPGGRAARESFMGFYRARSLSVRVLLAVGVLYLSCTALTVLSFASSGALGLFSFALSGLVSVTLLLFGLFKLLASLNPARHLHEQSRAHARAQGRVEEDELLATLRLPPPAHVGGLDLEPGIPLAYVEGEPVGLPPDADVGHPAVIAPTRSGKSFHLTDTLLRWTGPAVVIDPKGEQWERTAGFRSTNYGPVYRMRPHGIDLAAIYDLTTYTGAKGLHELLLQPWREGDKRHFLDKSVALFRAASDCSLATGEHPLRILARWSQVGLVAALKEAYKHSPVHAGNFADGKQPDDIQNYALNAWGSFTNRFAPFSDEMDAVAASTISPDWAQRNATIYICFPLQDAQALGPLAAAVVTGLMRQLQASRPAHRTLFAIDEMPTVGLPKLSASLATVGGLGVTMLLYAQSLPQIEDTYGPKDAMSILSNCTSQVYYPPNDPQTARHVSEAMGNRLEVAESLSADNWGFRQGTSYSTRYHPYIEPAEVSAMPPGAVAIFAGRLRHFGVDSRTVMAHLLAQLPPPPAITVPTLPPASVERPPKLRVLSQPEPSAPKVRDRQPQDEQSERPLAQEPYW